jgi:hypothetical protein
VGELGHRGAQAHRTSLPLRRRCGEFDHPTRITAGDRAPSRRDNFAVIRVLDFRSPILRAYGFTVRDVLHSLQETCPKMAELLADKTLNVLHHIKISVSIDEHRWINSIDTPVFEGSTVSISSTIAIHGTWKIEEIVVWSEILATIYIDAWSDDRKEFKDISWPPVRAPSWVTR